MSKQHYHGSCHCQVVRYEVDLDLSKGTSRCNCSICWKARAWFAIVPQADLKLLTSPEEIGSYRWTPDGKAEPYLTYSFCKHCGIRIYAAGHLEALGGDFYALNIPTLEDAFIDELAASTLHNNDNLHNKADQDPEDTRLL